MRPLVGLVTVAPAAGPAAKVSAGKEAKPLIVTILGGIFRVVEL